MKSFYDLATDGEMRDRSPYNARNQWDARFWIASVDHLQIEDAEDGLKRRTCPIPTTQDRAIEEANNG